MLQPYLFLISNAILSPYSSERIFSNDKIFLPFAHFTSNTPSIKPHYYNYLCNVWCRDGLQNFLYSYSFNFNHIILAFIKKGHYYNNKKQLVLGAIETNAYVIKSPASFRLRKVYINWQIQIELIKYTHTCTLFTHIKKTKKTQSMSLFKWCPWPDLNWYEVISPIGF